MREAKWRRLEATSTTRARNSHFVAIEFLSQITNTRMRIRKVRTYTYIYVYIHIYISKSRPEKYVRIHTYTYTCIYISKSRPRWLGGSRFTRPINGSSSAMLSDLTQKIK